MARWDGIFYGGAVDIAVQRHPAIVRNERAHVQN
jgi:hypothetical protein